MHRVERYFTPSGVITIPPPLAVVVYCHAKSCQRQIRWGEPQSSQSYKIMFFLAALREIFLISKLLGAMK